MNINRLLSILLRITAFLLVLHAGIQLFEWQAPSYNWEGRRTYQLVIVAVASTLGGVVWIYHVEVVRWILAPKTHPLAQSARAAALFFILRSLPYSVGGFVVWIVRKPSTYLDAQADPLINGTVSFSLIIIVAVALAFSPNIKKKIERNNWVKKQRAELYKEDIKDE